MCRAGSRLWVIICGRTGGSDDGVNLWYSDNDGGTWTKPTGGDLDSSTGIFTVSIDAQPDADTGTWELHMCWAAAAQGADWTTALKHADILSNVNTGTPGTVTVNTVDAGGTALGVSCPSIAITPTSSNPKVWIVANKSTSTGPVVENRVWRGAATTASPSWTTHSDINSTSSNDVSAGNKKGGTLAYWSVSAANKLTIIVKKPGTPASYDAFTFDPSAATPTLGTATNFGTMNASNQFASTDTGQFFMVAATADYMVFARHQNPVDTVDFYKTVNGTSWSQPSGWASLVMGRMQAAYDGTNFWVIQASTIATASQLKYRQITKASDTMGGVTNFSDTNGGYVASPHTTGSLNLYGGYSSGTTPFPIKSDFVSIGGAADVTPPGAAAFTATPNTAGVRIDLSATMPADIDVAQYEIRFSTSNFPASNRSDGSILVAATDTSANSVVTFSHTSLTNGTRYYYVVFVKDTSSNWNTGTQATGVAATIPTFLQRYTNGGVPIADGTTVADNNPILEFQLATANFEAGKVAHFRLRTGDNQATPPTITTQDRDSYTGDGSVKYEDPAASGTFVTVPTSGLTSTYFTRKLRVYTLETSSSRWCCLRVEQ